MTKNLNNYSAGGGEEKPQMLNVSPILNTSFINMIDNNTSGIHY